MASDPSLNDILSKFKQENLAFEEEQKKQSKDKYNSFQLNTQVQDLEEDPAESGSGRRRAAQEVVRESEVKFKVHELDVSSDVV